MISVVCVYSNKKALEASLLKSLKLQNEPYQLILVDNRHNKAFSSAASALNWAARKAKGEYLIFAHQDIFLVGRDWLKKAKKILAHLPMLGIAGAAGINDQGERVGYIDDGEKKFWGEPFTKPQSAQTLDECLTIIPKKVYKKLKFDEKTFDHWHCYAVDYALSAKKMGLSTYTIPLFVKHNTAKTNFTDLLKYQRRLFEKHKKRYKYIYTTCGVLSAQTLAIRERFPKSKIIDFYWINGLGRPLSKIFLRLAHRTSKYFN